MLFFILVHFEKKCVPNPLSGGTVLRHFQFYIQSYIAVASLPTCEMLATDMPLFRYNDLHATEGRGIMEPLRRAGLYGQPVLPLFDRPFANVTKRIPQSLGLS